MDFTEERCVVGTKCQAVYYSAEGQPQKCTGKCLLAYVALCEEVVWKLCDLATYWLKNLDMWPV